MYTKLSISASFFFIFLSFHRAGAQALAPENKGLTEYLRKADETRREKTIQLIREKKLLPLIYSNGFIAELIGVDEFNFPVYYQSESNLNAARSLGASRLWTGGNLGLSLNGQNMIIGEWDGGKVRETHNELNGRVTQKDNAATLNDHATHVAGTLIASGARAAAKGMAHQAHLHAYDWIGDAVEMSEAADSGLMISNHSYGQVRGWYYNEGEKRWEWYGDTTISATEDWRYGYYDAQAREWDLIANENPYYLIVKSAGNDRGKKPQDTVKQHFVWSGSTGTWRASTTSRPASGPFDLLSGSSNSKNTLTIAAVENLPSFTYNSPSDVKMSSFSSYGPTDDGRIKPDISGVGVGLESSISTGNNQYATYNGTSMAAPNVSGSLLLVQQHFKNKKGMNMRAATLKALVIHTAHEAGTADGPDYAFGWGMANIVGCIQTIDSSGKTSLILEDSLRNQTTYRIKFLADGINKISATLVWNDPAATPLSGAGLNRRNSRLVNDLDVRIAPVANPTQQTFPWVLDPDNPTQAANRADNARDNVERIDLGIPAKGEYQLTITHKGNLNQNRAQHFSLILSNYGRGVKAGFKQDISQLCEGGSVRFTNTTSGLYDSLQWTFNGGTPATSKAENPTVKYNSAGNFSVKLVAYQNGNKDSFVVADAVLVHPIPVVTLDTFAAVCDYRGGVIDLSGGMPAGGTYSGKGVRNGQFFIDSVGTGLHSIMYLYTTSQGCINADTQTIRIHPVPAKPVVTQLGDSLISTAADFYQWRLNEVEIPNARMRWHVVTSSGRYSVVIGNEFGCEALSENLNVIKTGLNTMAAESPWIVYPNPVYDALFVGYNDENVGTGLVALFDLNGKIVIDETPCDNWINTAHLPAGSYILQLKTAEKTDRMLIIKR